ncbi:MAG: P-type conjugative transfer protein VirB9 [Pseudomonadota bacterium]
MKRFCLGAILLASIATALPAWSLSIPQVSKFDKRIQSVVYNPEDVVRIYTKVGTATLIQLEEGETLEGNPTGLGIGDAKAWSINVRGHNIFLKPAASHPETNMAIVTNKRTYSFSLVMSITKKGQLDNTTYVLRFTYPDMEAKAKADKAHKQKIAEAMSKTASAASGDKKTLNKNYFMQGDKELAPDAAWDDGRFTYFKYDSAKALPAFYKVAPDGSEALINTHIEDDTVVIHETARKFMLRSGQSVLGIDNDSFDANGSFNTTGTSVEKVVRVNKMERGGN